MEDEYDSVPFRSPAFLSVAKREAVIGGPDYFIFAKGRYRQETDGGVMQMIVGDYAISFGELYRKITEILKDYPRNFFQIESLPFSREITERKKRERIKRLVSRHNSHRHLEKRI